MKRILALLVVGLTVLAPVTYGAAGAHKRAPKPKITKCDNHKPGVDVPAVTIHYTYSKPERKVHCVSIQPFHTPLGVTGRLSFVNDGLPGSEKPPFVLVLDASLHEDGVPFKTELLALKSLGPKDHFKVVMDLDCNPHQLQFVFLASKDKTDRLNCDCPERLGILGNPQVVVDGSGD